MPLQTIIIPDHITSLPNASRAKDIIDRAHQHINSYTATTNAVIHNFVHCDFELVNQALTWIQDNHILTGNNFCELGSGFGVAALLATHHGLNAVGIEIEPTLVDQATNLAASLDLDTTFYNGSFIPRNVSNLQDIQQAAAEVEHVSTLEDDIYDEIGITFDEFDLFFAFPWPGEEHFFESVFHACAADGACLLTYQGRNGMHLTRQL